MGIIFHEKTKEFHLYNEFISYVLTVLPNGHIGSLYYGKRVTETASYQYVREDEYRALTSFVEDDDRFFSLQYANPEFACYGTTDYFSPTFELVQKDGSSLSHFVYQGHMIYAGRSALKGLPHLYLDEEGQADSLDIYLLDEQSQTRLVLSYTIFRDYPAVTRSARFEQLGEESVCLNRALSMTLCLPDMDYDWLHLDGAWGRERHLQLSPLHQGCQSIYSLKGASSAEHNPFMALKRPTADEQQGEVLGFSLVYSGNFLAQVDVSSFQKTRVSMGIHPERFSWTLDKGEEFQTPEVVMVYSEHGLNGMSQTYHRLFQKHLVRGYWRDRERPVLLNNWEAMSFDFDEETILSLAKEAAGLGVELFVMDDGWFGKRNHDRAGLGDWTVNREKLPSGLTGIIDQVHAMGMKFGLWIEPEMVNKDSDLYRAHPDWIFHHPQHSQSHGRHQYTLDLSREDVYQNIHDQLHRLLAEHDIDYIKWDMNRYMTEVFTCTREAERQGETFHRYILNLYRLYDSLIAAFPTVLFESCSSGGARFDPGMLYYAPQTWVSDDTDAMERLKIQYGTSMVYPLNSMGCHVSASPNQQLGRATPLNTRANVAFFGSFGYELDLFECSQEELEEMKEQIAFYKAHRKIFQQGIFTRLKSPFDGEITAWQVQSSDGQQVIVGYYRRLTTANLSYQRLYLQGLEEEGVYHLDGEVYTGSQLMHTGLSIRHGDHVGDNKDFTSCLMVLQKQQ
ncbi:TPA: alpha-galactosidase [Streptococcus suis 2524]|uniref:alpha-galactosidase n=1 Tax=Streptococcus suis TaxID=1307 RepID=UPI0003FC1C47|nr:alpha-galactosidase [Streptococcus suis]RRR29216.1 alpha-galactosidase [Streptococcus suis]RRR36707.1 alpha-galactosidase [Streptococcus suis]RRR51767.1 alpha-galactosidase [Streptococcus suis]RRR56852.1 alpha-galactosidase [Streptococcus suis]HEM3218013.1 alpha-galactosidase [Streptococcus suis 2524]